MADKMIQNKNLTRFNRGSKLVIRSARGNEEGSGLFMGRINRKGFLKKIGECLIKNKEEIKRIQ